LRFASESLTSRNKRELGRAVSLNGLDLVVDFLENLILAARDTDGVAVG
jgi:hypothetical protein